MNIRSVGIVLNATKAATSLARMELPKNPPFLSTKTFTKLRKTRKRSKRTITILKLTSPKKKIEWINGSLPLRLNKPTSTQVSAANKNPRLRTVTTSRRRFLVSSGPFCNCSVGACIPIDFTVIGDRRPGQREMPDHPAGSIADTNL